MIFMTDGTPVRDALVTAGLRLIERRNHRRPRNYLLRNAADGGVERSYRILHDKLGDVYRVYREGHRHQPGRGYAERQAWKERKVTDPLLAEADLGEAGGPLSLVEKIMACLEVPGATQRKVAAALGISLGKLQRELRKAQPVAA